MLVADKATSILFYTDNVFREPGLEKNPQLIFIYYIWMDPFLF